MKPEDITTRCWDGTAAAGLKSEWTQHPLVEMAVCLRISGGTNKFWLNWILEDKLDGPFPRALSLTCGTGFYELLMAKSGKIAVARSFGCCTPV